MKVNDKGQVLNKEVDELTDRTQRIVEGAHYSMREYNLKLDDVINDQRNVIYTLRNKVLEGEELFVQLKTMLNEAVDFVVQESCPENESSGNWNFQQIEETMNALLLEPSQFHLQWKELLILCNFLKNRLLNYWPIWKPSQMMNK